MREGIAAVFRHAGTRVALLVGIVALSAAFVSFTPSATADGIGSGPNLVAPAACSSSCTFAVGAGEIVDFEADGTGDFDDDTFNDGGNTNLTMTFNWGDGTEATAVSPVGSEPSPEFPSNSYEANTTHTYTTPGVYTLGITIYDDFDTPTGETSTADYTVDVGPRLSLASSQAHPVVGESVTYTADAAMTAETPCTTCSYSFATTTPSNGSGPSQPSSTSNTFSTSFTASGSWTVNGSVTDSGLESASANASETVQVSPALGATLTPPNNVVTGQPASFAVNATGGYAPSGYSYSWSIDGQAAPQYTGTSANPTFTTTGNHTVSVTVSDTASPAHTVTQSATVNVASPCTQTVSFQLTQVTTSGCLQQGANGAYTTTSAISINGIPIPAPPSGHPITITPPDSAHPGGQIAISTVNITLDGFDAYSGSISWNLPANNANHLATVASLAVPSGASIEGLQVGGSISLEFGIDSSGTYYALFPIEVDLPNVFKDGPSGSAGGVSGQASIRVDRNGVHLDGLKVQVSNAWIGSLQVNAVCFSYVPGGSSGTVSSCAPPDLDGQPFIQCGSNPNESYWAGTADVTLPTSSNTTIGVFGAVSGDQLANLGGFADNLGTSVPIVDGVFLTRIGIGLCVNPPPFQLKGVVGVSALPDGSNFALTVDGSFDFTDTNPWSLNLTGEVYTFGTDVGGGYLTIYPTGLIYFGVNANLNLFSLVSINGSVAGWVQTHPSAFSVTGNVNGCVKSLCANASAVVSSIGLAGCLNLGTFTYYTLERNSNWHWYAPWRVHWQKHTYTLQAGFGYRWHGSVSLFGGSCDLGDYTATPAAAGDPGSFTVPAGTSALAVQIAGAGGAPDVSVSGPGGVSIPAPDASGFERLANGDLLVENPTDGTTSLLLINPAAGQWTVTEQPDSPAVTSIETASAQPPATAIGAVKPVGHGRYGLNYAYALQPGTTMQLFVRGPHGSEQALGGAHGTPCEANSKAPGRAGRLCQDVTFTPVAGEAGTRTVVGLISRGGLPDGTVTIASFKLATPLVPRAPRVAITRGRGGITVQWLGVVGASHYAISVNLSDGRELALMSHGQSVFVAGVTGATTASVGVWGIESDGVIGREGTASLKALPQKHKHKHG